MTRQRCIRFAAVFGFLGAAAFAPADAAERKTWPNDRSAVGINLGGVTYWSTEVVFADLFKHSQTWKSQRPGQPYAQGGPLDLIGDGWIRSFAPGGQFADSIVLTGLTDRFPRGPYTLLYDGEGEFRFRNTGDVIDSADGRARINLQEGQTQISVQITKTNPKDPVRNIRFLWPGCEKTYQTRPFNRDFLKRWEKFRVLRFMDFQRTNNSQQVRWSDRPNTTIQTQGSKEAGGVALEYMIQLANALHADPWFCMPHQADDQYVRQFAMMVKQRLDPDLTVYVEYSNECWNGIFGQARYCRDKGKELRLSDNDFQAQLRYYSKRSVEIFKIWEEVFGGTDRLVRVLAAQSANPWTSVQVMDFQDAYKQADALGIAPYFGHALGNPKNQDQTTKMTVDQVLDACEGYIEKNNETIARQAEEAWRRSLRLVAYEGGQHIVGHGGAENNQKLESLFHAANRHERMGRLYKEYLDGWRRSGGTTFVAFSSMGRFSKWGCWGLMEHHGQTAAEAPKYRAVVEFLEKNPQWW